MKMSFHAFRSLKVYNYRVWTVGSLVSNVGTWMQRVSQDWLVLTQLTRHDATALGIVTGLQFAPQLLFLPWTGIAADRLNQRKLLIFTQALMGVLAVALGALTVAGIIRLWQVYVFAFLSGAAAALDAPVRQTFVSELVGEEYLSNAVGLNSTSFNAARMVGPAAAGLLIAKVGTGWAFLLNGLSFGAVILAMLLLRKEELVPHDRTQKSKGAALDGFQYVWRRRDLRAILFMLALIGTFGLNFPIFTSTMAVKVFHTDARGFGLLSSIMAVGTVAGALMSAGRDRPSYTTLQLGTGAFGLGCLLAAISPGYWLFAVALMVMGGAALTFTNATTSMMQVGSDPAMRGRVMALRLAVALGGTPIGAPLAGWIANNVGPRWSLGLGAISGILAAVIAFASFPTLMKQRFIAFGHLNP